MLEPVGAKITVGGKIKLGLDIEEEKLGQERESNLVDVES